MHSIPDYEGANTGKSGHGRRGNDGELATDGTRSKNAAFTALSLPEKCARMFAILEQDPLYPGEYREFVAGLSYTPSDATPDFAEALAAMRTLAECIC